MGFNIGEVSGYSGGPGNWSLTVDLTDPSVTSVTGDFDVTSVIFGSSLGEADNYAASDFSANFGTYASNFTLDADGVFTFDIDRQAVFQSGSDQTLSFTITGTSGANSDDDGVSVTLLICVARGTLVDTADSARPVERLWPGDRVRTRDNGMQQLRWVGSRSLSAADLAAHPDLCPVRIGAGALGPGVPSRDLVVSPQHRILIVDWRAQMLFGQDEVLVPAKALVNDRDIRVVDTGPVEYFHLLFDAHQVIYTDGAETESFHPAAPALSAVDAALRRELLAIFPDLRADPASYGPTARAVARVSEARALNAFSRPGRRQ